MSNLQLNRISAVLSDEQVNQALEQIKSLTTQLPFLLGLNNQERVGLTKINRDNKFFVQDTIEVVKEDSGLLPTYVSLEELRKDYNLYLKLDQIILAIDELRQKLDDTQMLAGSEAYNTSLMVYRMYQLAAQNGIPGADTIYRKLKTRFERKSTPQSPQDDPNKDNSGSESQL